MTQTEAVILALHILGGHGPLKAIQIIALCINDVDWSQANEPDANIRRIVRTTPNYICPDAQHSGYYKLIAPVPEHLKNCGYKFVPGVVQKFSNIHTWQTERKNLTETIENQKKEIDLLRKELNSVWQWINRQMNLKTIVDYCCFVKIQFSQIEQIYDMIQYIFKGVDNPVVQQQISRIRKQYKIKSTYEINIERNIGRVTGDIDNMLNINENE